MKLNPVYVEARDLPDAWFQLIYKLVGEDLGFKYVIDRGSYEGSMRHEFDFVTVYIKFPHVEPLIPQIPPQYGIPDPVTPGYIEEYLPYLMTPKKEPGEQYTYGERLSGATWLEGDTYWESNSVSKRFLDQIEYWIAVMQKTPGTNQAVLQVAQPSDALLSDPPCLRHIDMRIRDGVLIFYPYFRSWDLYNGFPANLAAISHLQRHMATEIGVEAGPMIASSKGLHLYKYVWEFAEMLRNKQ